LLDSIDMRQFKLYQAQCSIACFHDPRLIRFWGQNLEKQGGSVGRAEPRIGVIVTMGYLDEFWFLVVLGVSHRDDHFCQRNHGRISFGFW